MSTQENKPRKPWKRLLITAFAGIVVLLLLVLYQAGFFAGEQIPPGRASSPPSVQPRGKTIVVAQHDVPVIYTTVGTLHSRDEIDISSRILARITEVKVRSGDKIKQGDVLVKLDDTDLAAAVAQAKKEFTAAQANIRAARERVNAAIAAKDLALVERNRMRLLLAGEAISKQKFDQAESAARQATAAWNQAVQDEQAMTAQAAAGGEALKQAQAALAYATLASPMAGIVSERLADPGDLANPGKIIIRLFNPARLRLEVPVRESVIKAVKLGDTVRFDVPALSKSFAGDIREIVPAVDPGSRTFMIMVCVGAEPELMPGMFGVFHLRLGTEKAVLVPAKAISRVGQLEYASMLVDGAMRRVLVRTAKGPDNMRKVISGLAPGMKILVPE